ncbi:unnamed protein product [Nippostrongylus brasiliensis]|uniref:ADP-ribosylation factor 1-like 1 (inferred by orthology to a C. elegans protein) n=1 Tax=Nippostrongylus brasiliensis TaxID=27835 RepID=A0A158R1C6_NIPBR|nr:unnamed protein product [Nippostrongylus brasiliensis]
MMVFLDTFNSHLRTDLHTGGESMLQALILELIFNLVLIEGYDEVVTDLQWAQRCHGYDFIGLEGNLAESLWCVGLDNAGKTTVLYKLKLGEVITTIPTIGFNLETVEYRNVSFTVWDVGGQQRIRALWKYYFRDTQAIIFVVDSSDTDRMEEARNEIHALIEDSELHGAAVLVFANKQDLPNAMDATEVSKALDMHMIRDREKQAKESSLRRKLLET